MPEFKQLTQPEIHEIEDFLLERPKNLVLSSKAQLFLDALGLGPFLQTAEAQKKIYDDVKKQLRNVRTEELQHQSWRVQNALVIALRKSLWGDISK